MRLTALVGALWREVWPTLTSSVDAVRVSIITSVRDSSACRSQSRLRHCTTQQTRTTHSAPTPLVETASRAVRQNPCPTQATPTCLVGAATAASKYDVTRLTYFNRDLLVCLVLNYNWTPNRTGFIRQTTEQQQKMVSARHNISPMYKLAPWRRPRADQRKRTVF